ncbi:MAG: glycosyltransferase family 39 protein [Oscillospiraceae bacterium]
MKTKLTIVDFIFAGVMLALGLIARFYLFPMISGDYTAFLQHWVEHFETNGGFAAVGDDIGDYSPMYYYILAALTYLPLKSLFALKMVSVLFDIGCAVTAFCILYKAGAQKNRCFLGAAAVFLLPTAILNSAAWAQCDSIYTLFLLLGLYQLIRAGRSGSLNAGIFFGIAFSFKLQAIFLFPLFALFLLKEKRRWIEKLFAAVMIPAMYILSLVPAVLAGGNFVRMLMVYVNQANGYAHLNMHIANIWALVADSQNVMLGSGGVFLAGAVTLAALYYFWGKPLVYNAKTLTALALFFALLIPFLLPYMHERYYYPADIIAVLFAALYAKRAWVLAVVQFCSFEGYMYFLLGEDFVDLKLLALGILAAIVTAALVLRDTAKPLPSAPLNPNP